MPYYDVFQVSEIIKNKPSPAVGFSYKEFFKMHRNIMFYFNKIILTCRFLGQRKLIEVADQITAGF